MGHAVYKTVDPRSMVLKELSKKLSEKTNLPWFDITKKIEETTAKIMKNRKEKDIFPNVDLYSASVYHMLDIPMDLNTPIFAISRVSGWAAHVIEEKFAEAAPKQCCIDLRQHTLENMKDHKDVLISQYKNENN